MNFLRHGVKVGPGPQDPGHKTLDPPQSLKVQPRTPLRFESGTPGHPSKFKSGTPGPHSKFKKETQVVFPHCFT